MKRTAILLWVIAVFAVASNAQVLPAKIKKFLDGYYTSTELGAWKQAPGRCDGSKWLLTGDFNGDGRTDYIVRITTGKTAKQKSLHLIGFINEKGDYTPDPFFEEQYTGDVMRSASSVIKRGTKVDLGLGSEGEGPSVMLKTDAVTQYICETDASITYTFKNGGFKNIQDGYATPIAGSAGTVTSTQPTVVQTNVPPPTWTPPNPPAQRNANPPVGETEGDIPDLTGTYTIFEASEKASASTGTVTYDGMTITFTISDGRSFSKSTAHSNKGTIMIGWGSSATVSADGRTIFWSNNTKWVRR